jgi:hypothetical protein
MGPSTTILIDADIMYRCAQARFGASTSWLCCAASHLTESFTSPTFLKRTANAPSQPWRNGRHSMYFPSSTMLCGSNLQASVSKRNEGIVSSNHFICPWFSSASTEHVEYTKTPPGFTQDAAARRSSRCMHDSRVTCMLRMVALCM